MAYLPGGTTIEQKIVTVAKDDATVNAEIETQALDNWALSNIVLDGSNVILVFTRTTVPA